jgi:hypothetical protein
MTTDPYELSWRGEVIATGSKIHCWQVACQRKLLVWNHSKGGLHREARIRKLESEPGYTE